MDSRCNLCRRCYCFPGTISNHITDGNRICWRVNDSQQPTRTVWHRPCLVAAQGICRITRRVSLFIFFVVTRSEFIVALPMNICALAVGTLHIGQQLYAVRIVAWLWNCVARAQLFCLEKEKRTFVGNIVRNTLRPRNNRFHFGPVIITFSDQFLCHNS